MPVQRSIWWTVRIIDNVACFRKPKLIYSDQSASMGRQHVVAMSASCSQKCLLGMPLNVDTIMVIYRQFLGQHTLKSNV